MPFSYLQSVLDPVNVPVPVPVRDSPTDRHFAYGPGHGHVYGIRREEVSEGGLA